MFCANTVASDLETFTRAHVPAVRDSKNPTGSALIFARAEWSAFTAGLGAGEFD